MATSGIFFYSQIDVQGKYYPSKGDIIVFNVNNITHRGTILSVQGDYSIVDVSNMGRKRIQNTAYTCESRYINTVPKGKIPVELFDLVSLKLDNEKVFGIIEDILGSNQIHVTINARNSRRVVVDISQISFIAKGYGIDTMQRSISKDTMTTYPGRDLMLKTPIKPGAVKVETIVVNAPCVVKVVPHNGDPNQFDDLMEVYFPEDPEHPKLYPLIRMTCGTILVVQGNWICFL